MMNCREATQLMSASQERELSLPERMLLGMHTMMCKGQERVVEKKAYVPDRSAVMPKAIHFHLFLPTSMS